MISAPKVESWAKLVVVTYPELQQCGCELVFSLSDIGSGARDDSSQGIQIVSATRNGVRSLYYPVDAPAAGWTDVSIPLGGPGWWWSNGQTATSADVCMALHSAVAINIQAEYVNGADVAALDDVVLYAQSDEASTERR